MPKEQRTFTKEFKLEAVRLVQTSGKSITQVARDLGIADSTLHHWCKVMAEQGEQAFPGSGHQTAKARGAAPPQTRVGSRATGTRQLKKSSSHLLTGCQMKYRFIVQHQQEYPVQRMCQVLEVSVSGYYGWKQRPASARQIADERLSARIRQAHEATYRIYGSRRIRAELAERGSSCGRKRVVRLMRQQGLHARRRRHRTVTTDSQHSDPVAPNLLDREFSAPTPNSKWVTDITGGWTTEGWLYVAVVLDLFSRLVVGWAMAAHRDAELVEQALQMALLRRHPAAGLLHHSDRGSQYTSGAYQARLAQAGIQVSMSGKGDGYDNAAMESFFSSLKGEWTDWHTYQTHQEAPLSIFEYIEVFYNRQRRHSTLGYLSPVIYEQQSNG